MSEVHSIPITGAYFLLIGLQFVSFTQAQMSSSYEVYEGPQNSPYRIIGGKYATIGQFPYQARLEIFFESHYYRYCGATLVEYDEYAFCITAAHCVWRGPYYNESEPWSSVGVFLGDIQRENYEVTESVYGIKKIMIHPDYDPRNQWNDLALLFLDRVVIYKPNVTTPAKLPEHHDWPLPKTVYVSGWGDDSILNPHGSYRLQYVEQKVFDYEYCHRYNSKGLQPGQQYWFMSPNAFCTANTEKHFYMGSCHGDSGGPAVDYDWEHQRFYLAGLVSTGPQVCGIDGYPVAYTRISHYIDWIRGAVLGHKKYEQFLPIPDK